MRLFWHTQDMRWTSTDSVVEEYAKAKHEKRPGRQLVSFVTAEMTLWLGHEHELSMLWLAGVDTVRGWP